MSIFSIYRPAIDKTGKLTLHLISTALVLLITFNISWCLMFVRLAFRMTLVKNVGKTLLNLDLLLLVGNLSIVALFIIAIAAIEKIKFPSKKYY